MAGEYASKLLQVEVASAVRRAVALGFRGAGRQAEAFVKGMDIGAKGDLNRVHVEIAAEVRQAVSDAYRSEVESQRLTQPYQRFNRRSGYLGSVIRRRDLVRADSGGLHFINQDALDKEAAHWARLNFGAGSEAGPQPGAVPIRLFGQETLEARLPYGPSPGFVLPKGFFIHGGRARLPNSDHRGRGSTGNFIPSRKSPYEPTLTVGIRGRHFLEAGLEEMSRQFPIKYADLLNEWIQRGGRKARAVNSVID